MSNQIQSRKNIRLKEPTFSPHCFELSASQIHRRHAEYRPAEATPRAPEWISYQEANDGSAREETVGWYVQHHSRPRQRQWAFRDQHQHHLQNQKRPNCCFQEDPLLHEKQKIRRGKAMIEKRRGERPKEITATLLRRATSSAPTASRHRHLHDRRSV